MHATGDLETLPLRVWLRSSKQVDGRQPKEPRSSGMRSPCRLLGKPTSFGATIRRVGKYVA